MEMVSLRASVSRCACLVNGFFTKLWRNNEPRLQAPPYCDGSVALIVPARYSAPHTMRIKYSSHRALDYRIPLGSPRLVVQAGITLAPCSCVFSVQVNQRRFYIRTFIRLTDYYKQFFLHTMQDFCYWHYPHRIRPAHHYHMPSA